MKLVAQMAVYRNSLEKQVYFTRETNGSLATASKSDHDLGRYDLSSGSIVIVNCSDCSIDSLENAFRKLGFQFQPLPDHDRQMKTHPNVLELLSNRLRSYKEVIKQPLSAHDCFVCAIIVSGEDWSLERMAKLEKTAQDLLNNKECSQLMGRPKIFLFFYVQAEQTVDSNGVGERKEKKPAQKQTKFLPRVSDFLFAYFSLSPNHVDDFAQAMMTSGAEETLDELLTNFNANINAMSKSHRAQAFYHSSLIKQISFKFTNVEKVNITNEETTKAKTLSKLLCKVILVTHHRRTALLHLLHS